MRTFTSYLLLSTACGLGLLSCSDADRGAPPADEPVGVARSALVMAPGWVAGSGWPAPAVVALTGIDFERNAQIRGDVAVITSHAGPYLQGNSEATLGVSVELRGSIRADSLQIKTGSHVFGGAGYNELSNHGVIDGAQTTPLSLPLAITVPNVPNFSAGTSNVDLASGARQTLGAGSHGSVLLRAGSASQRTVLSLSGGTYNLKSLELADDARVECTAACQIRIKERLSLGKRSYLGPAGSSGLLMSAVEVIVEGANSGSGGPNASTPAAAIGNGSELKAFIFVPNGTLHLRPDSQSVGKFVARDVRLGSDAEVEDGTGKVVLPDTWVTGPTWPKEALTALSSIELKEGANVRGDVATLLASQGPMLSAGFELALGDRAKVTGDVRADDVSLRGAAIVTGSASYNELDGTGTVQGSRITPLSLPLEITVPAFPSFTAGTTAIELPAHTDRSLAAGNYGAIRLVSGSSTDKTVLSLNGGIYQIADLEIGDQSRVECASACEIRVKNRVAMSSNAYLGPGATSGVDVKDVRVFVEGQNGGDGSASASPAALATGTNASLRGFVFVANGTLNLRSASSASGRLVARDILLAADVSVDVGGTTVLPPVIHTQPQPVSVIDGERATFTVVASGTTLTLEWQRDRVAIPGATGDTYTLDPAHMADQDSRFRVVISNSAGTLTSAEATLTVAPRAPVITQQPGDVTVTEFGSVTFTCTASGTDPTYAWQKDGVDIPGADQPSYTLAEVAATDAGAYSCSASNAAATAFSNPASLTVILLPPAITLHPEPLTVQEGLPATFSCATSGSSVHYQWQKDEQDISGATQSSFTIAAVRYEDRGAYRCIATNSSDSVESDPATLEIALRPPEITEHPINTSVIERQSVNFSCAASGTNVSYVWRNSTGAVVGLGPVLRLNSVTTQSAGYYHCVASNTGGEDPSMAALLTVQLIPPEITDQPHAVTATEGQSASFSCAASGTDVHYRWQKGEQDLPGATDSTLTITQVAYDDAGSYRCIATNTGGSATSHATSLVVNLAPPAITLQPTDAVVVEREAVSFSCAASGTNVSYQWQKGGQDLAGATQASFTIAHVAYEDEGNYHCIARNSGGSAPSASASLRVQLLSPSITQHPHDLLVTEGQSASLTCAASGTNISYRWLKEPDALEVATGATLLIPSAGYVHAGSYRCEAKNSAATVLSHPATLGVRLLAPAITEQPEDVQATEREDVRFQCAASGTNVSYQWQKDGHDIQDATSARFEIAGVAHTDAGQYRCIARNSTASATSDPASLTVDLIAPVFTAQPESLITTEGEPASFSCTASGTDVSYRWQREGQDLPGATSATYTIASVRFADEGSYRCIAHNTGHDVPSDAATLGVILFPPAITQPPAAHTVDEGEDTTFSCAASGSSVSYRWQKEGHDIEGANTATLTVSNARFEDDADYRCIATNSTSSAESVQAHLTVRLSPPRITTQPAAVTAIEGQTASFTCAASGTNVSYQWQNSAEAVVGTGPSLTLSAVSYLLESGYRCIATNTGGSAQSELAQLTVTLIAPAITTQPQDLTVTEQQPAAFHCAASGTNVNYRWQKIAQDIPGATAASYAITSATVADAASYTCIATNTGGSVQSRAATLSVDLRPPAITAQPQPITAIEGQSATFTCAASGTHVSYRWQKNTQDLPEASAATFTLQAARYEDEGEYRCIATNTAGSATSSTASLHVTLIAPVITQQPANTSTSEGSSATFTCAASGTNVTYRWLKLVGTESTPAGTGATLTISAARPEDAASYRCEATNTTSTVTSQPATLTVQLTAPSITTHPAPAIATEGQPASFTCAASGSDVSYRWQKDEQDIQGASDATFAIARVTHEDAGRYRCIATNTTADATSEPALLAVVLLAPAILQQPSNANVTEGQSASFTCAASGSQVTYRWQKNGADIAGDAAKQATYTIAEANHTDAGPYRCIAHNASGDATSEPASLSITLLPPVITRQPLDVTVAEGQTFTVSVEATGTLLGYQWQRAGLAIPGATSPSYAKAATLSDDASQYRVVVSNTGNDVTSQAATVRLQDNVQPTLALTNPAQVTINGDRIAIAGSVTDNSGQPLHAHITSDRYGDQQFDTVLNPDGSFSSDMPLELGENIITVTVRDSSGNTTTQIIKVIVEAAEAPSILFSEPAHGSTVTTDRIRVRGVVRSSQPADQIRLSLGDDVQFPTGAGPDHPFEFQQVRVVQGINVLTVVAETPRGNVSKDLVVTLGTATGPVEPFPPRISLQAAQPELYVVGSSFTVSGSVVAQRCVQSVKVNGTAAQLVGTGPNITFSRSLSFAALGTDHVTVDVLATDCDGRTASAGYIVHRDDGAPLLTVDNLPLAPSVQPVTDTPYRLTGRVSEQNLAGLSISGQSLPVLPLGAGEWSFAIDVPLVRQTDQPLDLDAWDHAGNRTRRSVILRLETPIALELLSPAQNTELLVSSASANITVVVLAASTGLAPTDSVTANFDAQPPVLLTRGGDYARGELTVTATPGAHSVSVSVRNAAGDVLQTRSATLTFIDQASIALQVMRQDPVPDATDVEANSSVTLHFNRPIDPALLQLSVLESVHGKIYKDALPGADILTQSQVELIEIHRERQPVPGNTVNFPGDGMVTFYPSQDFGYGGEVLVEAVYDEQPLWHSRFVVRRLPTLVHGFVADHLRQPIEDVLIDFPQLGRTLTTNAEGGFSLGFGEPASAMIAAGRYRAIVNPGMTDPRFGSTEAFVEVNAEALNHAPLLSVTRLNHAEPFHEVASRDLTPVAFAQGDLELDLSRADLTFPDGQDHGNLHAQFATAPETGFRFMPSAYAEYGFAIDGGPVDVQGELGVRIRLPKRHDSFGYVASLPDHMILVGLDPNSLLVVPVGVGQVDKTAMALRSVGPLQLSRLDFIGVSALPAPPELLARYAAGELPLFQLIAHLEASR